MIKFIMITNSPGLAHMAELNGVGRIFVDLEQLGKKARQGHLSTHISNHSTDDVALVKYALEKAELLVRLNPLNENTHLMVELAINNGADILMLPMFRASDEVEEFARMVDRRVKIIPLVETNGAVESIKNVVNIQGVSEIYIGLNDLHLDMQMKFIFEPLANGLIDKIAAVIKSAGLPFGFGGIARAGEGIIPGELVLGEHIRLGSSSVILSRTFCRGIDLKISSGPDNILATEIQKLEYSAKKSKLRSEEQVESDRRRLQMLVEDVVKSRSNETAI